MESKRVTILVIGLVILKIQCEYTSCGSNWLTPFDLHSRVAACDVVNLVLRIRIMVCIGELHLALGMIVRNMIFSHVWSTSCGL